MPPDDTKDDNYSNDNESVPPDEIISKETVKLPNWLCWTVNIVSLFALLSFSGIIFGWAPLELMLMREGQYSELCGNPSLAIPCPERTNQLHRVFTLAQFWLSFVSLPVGYMLDHLPKSVVLLCCAAFQISGLLLFAVADSSEPDADHFDLAYSLMAIGGAITMLAAFPATFLVKPVYQAGLLASIGCLFDASSVVFFIFQQLQEKYGTTRETLFVAYAVWAAFLYTILVGCWVLLEKYNWKEFVLAMQSSANDAEKQQSDIEQEENAVSSPKTFQDPHIGWIRHRGIQSKSVWEQLKTSDFGLAVVVGSIHMLRCNFFIMSADDYLYHMGDDDATYAKLFSWILPCGIIFVPSIERTISVLGIHSILHVANGLGIVFGIILWIPSLQLQVFNFVLFAAFRAYLYATLNAFLAMTFGVETMGRVFGFVFTTAAVVTLVQYPVAVWTQSYANGDYLYANMFFVALCIFPTSYACYYTHVYNIYVKNEEGDEMTDSLISTKKDDGKQYGSIQQSTSRNEMKKVGSPRTPLLHMGSPGNLRSLRRKAENM